MNIINKLISLRAEQILKPQRKQAEAFKNENLIEYEKYLPSIGKVYKDVFYWHGTGRYQYRQSNKSRYEEKDQSNFFDTTESIVESGLTPHLDPFVKIDGRFVRTISLTEYRMHARLYAGVHRYEGTLPLYEFGTTKFWLFLFVILVAVEIVKNPTKSARDFIKNVFGQHGRDSLKQWPQAFKKTKDTDSSLLLGAYKWHSDIFGNHPVLFGIRKDKIKALQIGQFMDNLETRTLQSVGVENFTHVEVPLDRVREMEKLLKSKNIELAVIPMEFGEVYSSQFTAEKLI